MQPEERDPAYLWDMLQAAREVEEMMAGNDLEAFLGNRMLLRAIERSVEIIGEAARRVSESYMTNHPGIPWRKIIGLSIPGSVSMVRLMRRCFLSKKGAHPFNHDKELVKYSACLI